MTEQMQISGRVTLGAQIAAPLGNGVIDGSVTIRVLSTGPGVFVGNDGAGNVNSDSGFPLYIGEWLVLSNVQDLNQVWLWAPVADTVVAWISGKVGS